MNRKSSIIITKSFQNRHYKNKTSLSGYVWKIKKETGNTNINMVNCKNSSCLFKYYEDMYTLPS